MARIRISDLPILEELGQEELQGIYGEGLFPGDRLRQLAAAATLGITLASAPFAVAGNQGKGPGGGQGGSQGGRGGSWSQSQGPARTVIPVHIQHGTQPGQFRQQNVHVAWQGGSDRGGWHGDGERGGEHRSAHVASFCKEHGTQFSHGFYYVGRDQKHFTERWWDARFETYLYFDPFAECPYYWCEAHGVFYPIDYIETVGPGAKGPGPVVGGARGGAPLGGAPLGGAPLGGASQGGGPVGEGGAAGGAPVGSGAPVGAGSAAGAANGAPGGGAGGAQGGGAQGGGAPGGDAAGGAAAGGGAAPIGGAPGGASENGAAEGAAAGGAGGAAPAAPGGGAGAGTPSGVSVAKNVTPVPKKELQRVPAGTFDGAIPDDAN